ncbi:hypothetical protein ACFQ4O_13610 [Methylopila musalis]|uniref:Uncharacterized protein n=1 Tax=Methylopila musalis TaxID=1134781 RepID=A0ABW3Z9W1_9HYPH
MNVQVVDARDKLGHDDVKTFPNGLLVKPNIESSSGLASVCLRVTDAQFDKLVEDGLIEPQNLEAEKAARAADTEAIFALVDTVTVQLSSGIRRDFSSFGWNTFECIEPLLDIHYPYGPDHDEEPIMIRAPYEGYHRTLFLNAGALDYISFPTHKLEEDEKRSYEELIDD